MIVPCIHTSLVGIRSLTFKSWVLLLCHELQRTAALPEHSQQTIGGTTTAERAGTTVNHLHQHNQPLFPLNFPEFGFVYADQRIGYARHPAGLGIIVSKN